MSFKASGPKTRPERVKPPQSPPSHSTFTPSSWASSSTKRQTDSKSRRSSTSSAASFHSAHFPADEEATMVSASNDLKSAANKQFNGADYSSAIGTYDRALAELPSYFDFEAAVLRSNIAACYVKLEEWKNAIEAAEKGLDGLERVMPSPVSAEQRKKEREKRKAHAKRREKKDVSKTTNKFNSDTESESETRQSETEQEIEDADATVIELPSDNDEEADAATLKAIQLSDERKDAVIRIRTKLLLRKARAYMQLGLSPPLPSSSQKSSSIDPSDPDTNRKSPKPPSSTSWSEAGLFSTWSNLSTAQSTYATLAKPPYFAILPSSDRNTVLSALRSLPPLIDKAKEKEMGDMVGKLKELGNGLLKPFGLSTDMFKVQQGEGGGYSLSFDQGGGKKS